MKNIAILAVAALVLGWFVYAKLMRKPQVQVVTTTLSDMKKGDTAPVHYVENLQKDVQKADDTAEKAKAALKENAQNIDAAMKEAGQ